MKTFYRALQTLALASLFSINSLLFAAETITYFHWDATGSPVAATDEAGNVKWREEYKPHGERIQKQPGSANNTRWFTSHPQDPATGLIYAGARWIDPVIGRFMGIDPKAFTEVNLHSFNRYSYAANNPYKYVDPDGRDIQFAPGSTPQFKQQFSQMVKYLNAGRASGALAQLQARPETVYLKESTNLNDFKYSPGSKTITFHPLSGLEVTPGKVQTPALGVLHEAGHALQDLQNPQQLQSDAATSVPAYGNREEQRVIDTKETPAAIKLREPTRQHHGGTAVQVQCPVCDK